MYISNQFNQDPRDGETTPEKYYSIWSLVSNFVIGGYNSLEYV